MKRKWYLFFGIVSSLNAVEKKQTIIPTSQKIDEFHIYISEDKIKTAIENSNQTLFKTEFLNKYGLKKQFFESIDQSFFNFNNAYHESNDLLSALGNVPSDDLTFYKQCIHKQQKKVSKDLQEFDYFEGSGYLCMFTGCISIKNPACCVACILVGIQSLAFSFSDGKQLEIHKNKELASIRRLLETIETIKKFNHEKQD